MLALILSSVLVCGLSYAIFKATETGNDVINFISEMICSISGVFAAFMAPVWASFFILRLLI